MTSWQIKGYLCDRGFNHTLSTNTGKCFKKPKMPQFIAKSILLACLPVNTNGRIAAPDRLRTVSLLLFYSCRQRQQACPTTTILKAAPSYSKADSPLLSHSTSLFWARRSNLSFSVIVVEAAIVEDRRTDGPQTTILHLMIGGRYIIGLGLLRRRAAPISVCPPSFMWLL